jgi:hypothetical protein
VNESTFSLAVVSFDDPQNGQPVGIGCRAPPSSPASGLLTFE